MQQQLFTVGFTALFIVFAYYLCLTDEQTRLSNEGCRWGLFLSGLFAFLSYLTSTRPSKLTPAAPEKVKDNRAYAKDKEVLNN